MSNSEPQHSNFAESFDNIPAIDDDEQSKIFDQTYSGGNFYEKSIFFSRR